MRQVSLVAVLVLGFAATAAAQRVRESRCPAMGRGLVVVSYHDHPPSGDPEGGGGPWSVPREALMAPSMEAGYLADREWRTAWDPGATADFNRDGVCDVVWTREDSGRMAITLTDGTVTPPAFIVPQDENVFDERGDMTLVGSGDFVGIVSGGGVGQLPPPDGNQDLLLWNGSDRVLVVWASEAATFPADQRHAAQVSQPSWEPVVIGNIDGQGSPEVIWLDSSGQKLAYSNVVVTSEGLSHVWGGLLSPDTLETGWAVRAADDFDADGRDDLVLQNVTSEDSSVWFMNGPVRLSVDKFAPVRLAPADEPPAVPMTTYTIAGPR